MSRVPLADVRALSGWQQAQYDRFPSNLTRALLLLDERLAGQLPATANALRAATLSPSLREAIILRVAARRHSAYERFQHLEQARASGWNDSDIAHIEAGAFDQLPIDARHVLEFVDALVDGPDVTDHLLSQVRQVLNDQQLVTLIVLVGHYITVAHILAVLGVQLDESPDRWAGEH